MKRPTLLRATAIALSLFAGACGDRAGSASDATSIDAAPAANRVIEVRMVTDEKGNYFDPAEITARQGDVLRFRLVTGVHNVSFSAAGNPGRAGLPQPSGLLDSAGQTLDVPVRLAPGEYTFRCDPHVPFEMVGRLTVEWNGNGTSHKPYSDVVSLTAARIGAGVVFLPARAVILRKAPA